MVLGALGGTLTTYTFVYLGNHNREKERLQNDFSEKRLMLLAHLGYSNLQAKASDNSIVPSIKEDVLHFFDTTVFPVKDLSVIDACFGEDDGYKISADFDKTSGSFPRFQGPGSRLSLDEFMDLDSDSIESNLNGIFDRDQCEFIKRRWAALKNEDKPLPLDLFHPLLTCLRFGANKLTLSLFNPYDRPLTGSIDIRISLSTFGSASTQNYVLRGLEIREVKEVNFSYEGNFKVDTITLGDLESYFLIIKNCNHVNQGMFNLRIPDKLTENFWTSSNTLSTQRKFCWRQKTTGLEEQNSSVFWRGNVNHCNENTIFITKTWVEKLNACFFFNDGLPYEKIGNFVSEKMEKLNNFVWNQCVADKGAKSFNFNGPESYLRGRMKELLDPYLNENSIEDAVNQVLEGQIFVDAISFIKKLQTIPMVTPYLYVFKNLQARPDVFSIEAWMKNRNQKTKYILNVMRKFIDSKPIWQKQ